MLRRSAGWASRSSPPSASRSSATASPDVPRRARHRAGLARTRAPRTCCSRTTRSGTYAHTRPLPQPHAVDLRHAAAPVRNVTVDNNVVTGGRQVNARNSRGRGDRSGRPAEPHQHPLHQQPLDHRPARATCWTSRTSTTLTVTGNVQPLTSGSARLHRSTTRTSRTPSDRRHSGRACAETER